MGRYFEEFELGEVFETRSLSVRRETILAFAELTGDDNPLHQDSEFMHASQFGDIIAHGLLLESLMIGLIAELGVMKGTTIALLEANCRFHRAVLPGDEIRARMTITGKTETSKADRGVLRRGVELLNQRGQVTLTGELVALVRRRPLEPST